MVWLIVFYLGTLYIHFLLYFPFPEKPYHYFHSHKDVCNDRFDAVGLIDNHSHPALRREIQFDFVTLFYTLIIILNIRFLIRNGCLELCFENVFHMKYACICCNNKW